MKKFRLESVLEHRKTVESVMRRELAEANRKLADERERLAEEQGNQERAGKRMAEVQEKGAKGFVVQLYSAYLDRMAHRVSSQKQKVVEMESTFEEKQADLVEAMRRRKILDQLKQRHERSQQAQEEAAEQDFFDEVAVTSFSNQLLGTQDMEYRR